MTVADVLEFPLQRPEELVLYDALRRRQDYSHPLNGFTIQPQPWVVLRKGRHVRPDFIVTMRSGIAIEIDGSTHNGRYAIDASRDELLHDHGLQVLRICIEDTTDPVLVEDWVDRILARAAGVRFIA